jgi:hypothetical protein
MGVFVEKLSKITGTSHRASLVDCLHSIHFRLLQLDCCSGSYPTGTSNFLRFFSLPGVGSSLTGQHSFNVSEQ